MPRLPTHTLPSLVADGYYNVLSRYGTSQDNSTAWQFAGDGQYPDALLAQHYEGNGLFARIIDAPAEEAVKHGIDLGLKGTDAEAYIAKALDKLEWEENAALAIKWARLYGGSIIVMLIDDGRGIDEPLNLRDVRSIDELRVYERAIVTPDYMSMYMHGESVADRQGNARPGEPDRYYVSSIYGSFWVHASRCLVMRNGALPEQSTHRLYQHWGLPEYIRIKQPLREAVTAHSLGVKMLDRSVQPIYSMQGLTQTLEMEGGDDKVLKRLQTIDLARSILNSVAIDSEGEAWEFKTVPMAGVKDVIDTACNMLSAVSKIPQTILFGRSPAGQNSTGYSDLESYYNLVEGIQKLMLRRNVGRLIDMIIRVGLFDGDLDEKPAHELTFNPLWSTSETEKAQIEQSKAAVAQAKAQAAMAYIDMGVLSPTEVREALKKDTEFDVESMLADTPDDDIAPGEADAMAERIQRELDMRAQEQQSTEQADPLMGYQATMEAAQI